jgi:hypothetical protein
MYNHLDRVQITNHAEPECNGQYGTIIAVITAYDGYTKYYDVQLDNETICTCIDDEIMEG